MGGFVLENFLIKKEGWAKNAYLLHRFSKIVRRFLEKIKSPRKRRANQNCKNDQNLAEISLNTTKRADFFKIDEEDRRFRANLLFSSKSFLRHNHPLGGFNPK